MYIYRVMVWMLTKVIKKNLLNKIKKMSSNNNLWRQNKVHQNKSRHLESKRKLELLRNQFNLSKPIMEDYRHKK